MTQQTHQAARAVPPHPPHPQWLWLGAADSPEWLINSSAERQTFPLDVSMSNPGGHAVTLE